MNKKYLSVVLFGALTLGAAGMFTGCIDNDEPAGIEQLRGAKAELIAAKAVVEQARAEYILAQAEYQKALAAHEQANADYRQAQVEYQKLVNDLKAAENEKDKILYQEQIELAQQRMEEAALTHQNTMLELQATNAALKRNYELVLKQIAIAEAIMSDQQKVSVAFLKNEVNKTYAIINGGTYYAEWDFEKGVGTDLTTVVDGTPDAGEKQSLSGKLFDANEELYDAMLDVAHGFTDPENGSSTKFIAELENTVAKNKASVEAEQNKVTKLEEFLEKDVETADWRAEIAELEDSIKILKVEQDQLKVNVDKAAASPEYLKAAQEYKGIKDAEGNFGDISSDGDGYKLLGTAQKMNAAKKELDKAKSETELTLPGFERKLSDAEYELMNGISSISALLTGKSFKYDETKYKHDVDKGKVPTGLKTISDNVNKWVTEVSKYAVNDNTPESALIALENAKKVAEAAAKDYEADKANWQIAVNANKGVATPVSTTEFEKAVNAYNSAYGTLEAKIKAYNTAYDNAYTAGYNAKKEEMMAVTYTDKYKEQLDALLTDATKIANAHLDATALTMWGTSTKTPAAGEDIIKTYSQAYTDTEGNPVTAAQNATNVINDLKDEAQNQVNIHYADKTAKKDLEDQSNAAGLAKAASDKNVTDAKTAVDKAQTATIEAYNGFTGAITDFDVLAEGTYAQKRTDDAKKAFEKVTDGIVEDESAWYQEEKDSDGNPTGHLEAVRSTITSDELTAITECELDETLAEAAWTATSLKAFGPASNYADGQDRAVEPTVNEIMDRIENSNGTLTLANFGSYGTKISADNEVKKYQDLIDAKDMIAALLEDLKEAQSGLTEAIANNYDDKFGKLDKAYEDAVAANKVAKSAFEAEQAKVDKLSLEVDILEVKIVALGVVKKELIAAVNNHLDLDDPDTYDPDNFEEALKTALQTAKDKLVEAQKVLAEAEKALDDAQNSDYDKVAHCQRKVDLLMAELAAAQKDYDAALANLQKALEIMAKTAE